MRIDLSPLVKGKIEYAITRQKLNQMKELKKKAPGYDEHGNKIYKMKDNVLTPAKRRARLLKTRKYDGPFALVLFQTGDSVQTENIYVYQGVIYLTADEFARVWIAPSMAQYTDVTWTDDDVLLAEVMNKITKEKFAFQLPGEPTNVENWDWDSTDDANHTNKEAVYKRMAAIAEEYHLNKENVYGIIMLDC